MAKKMVLRSEDVYSALRRVRATVRSHILGVRLGYRVKRGYRLVPERELEACYERAIGRLQAEANGQPLGDYLEFGVCHGSSMACMHRVSAAMRLTDIRLVGFDSFAGLPPEADHPDEGPWRPGYFRSYRGFTERFLNDAGVDWARTVLVEGWFDQTLTERTRCRHRLRKAGVIMIDCDLYSSARQALEFCGPLIADRVVILFDDWHAGGLAARGLGEKRAFDEFMAVNPDLSAERLLSYSANAEVFLVRRAHPGLSKLALHFFDFSLCASLMAG
jgi:hypothetical protein